MENLENKSTTCCICLSDLKQPGEGRQTLGCGHVFHERCITELRRRGSSGRCPLCRATHEDLESVSAMFDRAVVLFLQWSYAAAYNILWEARNVDPDNVPVNKFLGEFYRDGHGVAKDTERAMELYDVASRGGDLDATYNLGMLHKKQGNLKKAMELWEVASRGGHLGATYNLGVLHGEHV